MTSLRTPREIGRQIMRAALGALMKSPGKTPRWVSNSMPYVKAFCAMKDWTTPYGIEEPKYLILYLYENLTYWRGEEARAIKTELLSTHKTLKEGTESCVS